MGIARWLCLKLAILFDSKLYCHQILLQIIILALELICVIRHVPAASVGNKKKWICQTENIKSSETKINAGKSWEREVTFTFHHGTGTFVIHDLPLQFWICYFWPVEQSIYYGWHSTIHWLVISIFFTRNAGILNTFYQ